MHVILLCTINDFPTYINLSEHIAKGHKICPTCEEGTCYYQLTYERKTSYLKHKKFLKTNYLKAQKHTILRKTYVNKSVYDGKRKDNVNARLDFVEMALQSIGKQTYMLSTCYTISKNEKRNFYECLKVECYMKILKRYVKNPHFLIIYIVEMYIIKETIKFCSDYMSTTESIGIPKS
ncbi:hypothetical protein CR513_56807, partial [Mucuna pruriens]